MSFRCEKCFQTKDVIHHWDFDICTTCARKEGLYHPNSNHQEIMRVEAEKERSVFEHEKSLQEAKLEEKAEKSKSENARRVLAERELARRHLLPFVKGSEANYKAGWVHADICKRLDKFARDVEEGLSPRLMITMPPRHGKLCADSTPVLTANKGWTTHGELEVGDYVFHPNGKPIKVLALSDKDDADYVVTTSKGDSIRCHGNHEWRIYDRRQSKWRTVEAKWLASTALHNGLIGKRGGRYHIQLPDVRPLQFDCQDLPLDPYVLGAWLGDGSRGKGCVSLSEKGLAIVSAVHSPNGERGHCIEVDSDDGLYLVGHNLTPTHNSALGSKTFPSWYLGRNPTHEVILTSYSSDLAKDFSRKCRDLLSGSYYKGVFDTRLDPKSKAVEKWSTSKGGGFTASGVSGPITGRGAHVGIIDDPVKDRAEAESATVRQTVKDWYSSTFYSRLAPGGGILIIQTRWHDDDLAGWLIHEMEKVEKECALTGAQWPDDADKWERVDYPAEATKDEAYRKKGEALHPERYPITALRRIKRNMIPRDWQALYQQNPVAEDGDYFTKDMFRFYDAGKHPPLAEMRIYSAVDLAISTKQDADYTVAVTVGIDRNQNIWLLDMTRKRLTSLGIIDMLFDIRLNWNPELLGIEAGQIELTLEPFIMKSEQERGVTLKYEKLKTRGIDKSTRARPFQGRMEQGKVYFPSEESVPWMTTLINELLRFPLGKNDDIVDALAWIGQMIVLFSIANQKQEKKPDSDMQKRLKQIMNGKRKRKAMTA